MDTFVGTDLDVPLPVLSSSVPVHSFVDPAGLILPQAQSLEIPAQQAAYAWDPPPVPWSREVFTPSGLGGCATVVACCSDCLLLYTYADAHCAWPVVGSDPPHPRAHDRRSWLFTPSIVYPTAPVATTNRVRCVSTACIRVHLILHHNIVHKSWHLHPRICTLVLALRYASKLLAGAEFGSIILGNFQRWHGNASVGISQKRRRSSACSSARCATTAATARRTSCGTFGASPPSLQRQCSPSGLAASARCADRKHLIRQEDVNAESQCDSSLPSAAGHTPRKSPSGVTRGTVRTPRANRGRSCGT